MKEAVRVEKSAGIATLTIDVPQARNAISDPDTISALVAAIRSIDSDPEVRVGIVTGAGRVFSSGGNLKTMRDDDMAAKPSEEVLAFYREGIQRIPRAFEEADTPIIAAVNGPAVGAGCDLACMCDIRIAAESARFAESFVKVGLVPGDGGAFLLQRVVGYARAAEMALTGEMLSAEEALNIGLVSRVVPDSELLSVAWNVAEKVARNPSSAVRLTKRLLREARHMRLDSVLDYSASLQAICHKTFDHNEAVEAFLENRPPNFTGSTNSSEA